MNAMTCAMHAYDVAAQDPVTQPAAFGEACSTLRTILNVNLRAAAQLVWDELERREQHAKAKATGPPEPPKTT